MKKKIVLAFVCLALSAAAVGCGGKDADSKTADSKKAEQVQEEEHKAESGDTEGTEPADAPKVIAVITEDPEINGFYKPYMDKAVELSQSGDFELKTYVAQNTTDWDGQYQAAYDEGADLIIGLGWPAADPARITADNSTGDTAFAVIDTNAFSDKVYSIDYNALEASFVMGVMAAHAFPEDRIYGCIASLGSAYGDAFQEGLMFVDPSKEVRMAFTASYTDEGIVYDKAMEMARDGINFIYFTAGSSFGGMKKAALELAEAGTPVYTVSQDTDETTPDNPYILSAQLKHTDKAVEKIINLFLAGELKGGAVYEGLSEGSVGIANITDPGNYINRDILTDEVIQSALEATNGIIDGSIIIETAPDEQNEIIN